MTEAEKGKKLFVKHCAQCHTYVAGGASKQAPSGFMAKMFTKSQGPALHGVIGAKAGTNARFAYSDAIRQTSLVWDEETLDVWLTNPKKLVPGTSMVFAGLKKKEERASLIAFLTANC